MLRKILDGEFKSTLRTSDQDQHVEEEATADNLKCLSAIKIFGRRHSSQEPSRSGTGCHRTPFTPLQQQFLRANCVRSTPVKAQVFLFFTPKALYSFKQYESLTGSGARSCSCRAKSGGTSTPALTAH